MPVDQNLQESSREDKTNDSVTLEPIRHIQKRGRGIVRSPFPRWPSVVVFREIMLGFTPTVGIEPRRFAPFGIAPCRQSHMSKPCHGGALAAFPKITSRRRRSGLSRGVWIGPGLGAPRILVPSVPDHCHGTAQADHRVFDHGRAEIGGKRDVGVARLV